MFGLSMTSDSSEEVVYTIRFDGRSKEILVNLIKEAMVESEQKIMSGDTSNEAKIIHQELLMLYKGVLYSDPQVIT